MKLYNWYYDKLSIGECFFYPRAKQDGQIISLIFVYGNRFLKIDVVSHYKEEDYDRMLSPNYASHEAQEHLITQIFKTSDSRLVDFRDNV